MKNNLVPICLILAVEILLFSCSGKNTETETRPPGKEETTKTELLETGAAALQLKAPFYPMDIYLVGFHPMKDDPSHQMEAHHYCTQVNEDFAQCVLFDGNTKDAKLTGIEYIISERLYDSLPEEEKKYWHPHNYEILSGQLVAPGIPDVAEIELMEDKMNSYGKTWHVWSTGTAEEGKGVDFPFGDPMLAWSFNRDGEAQAGLVENRDKRMNIDSDEKRKERKELVPLAKPQQGIDVLKDKFPRPTQAIPGVEDVKSTSKEN